MHREGDISIQAADVFDKCERALSFHPFAVIGGLLAFYFLVRLPDAIIIQIASATFFPLQALYTTDLLFTHWWSIRPDLASTVPTPSNVGLEYPPGFYLVTKALGTVRNISLFSFAWQALVPLLIYRLVSSVSSRLTALLLAILSIPYLTRSDWYAPDFLIQPLMLLAVLPLFTERQQGHLGLKTFLVVGFLTSLIVLFKHNIGVFFAILCGTVIYFDSFDRRPASPPASGTAWAYFFLGGFPLFGVIFFSKLLYLDEAVYYLLPFFAFWALFVVLLRQRSWSFDPVRFAGLSLAFVLSAILLPALVFIWFGSVIGYSKYWHVLFGMDLDFLRLLDHGIFGVVRRELRFDGLQSIYSSATMVVLYLFPFAVNCLVLYFLLRVLKGSLSAAEKFRYFGVGSVAIMSAFMFFPLEGYHILSTKLFIFAVVLAFFLHRLSAFGVKAFSAILALTVVPVFAYSFFKPINTMKTRVSYGTPEMRRIIGMPLHAALAEQLSGQAATIKRAVGDQPYYVVDSSGGTLIGLAAIVDNKYPQYYIEMREGILAEESTDAILRSLAKLPFAVVNKRDFDKFREGKESDVFLGRILGWLFDHYEVVDTYESPKTPGGSLLSFVVMKNKSYSA